LPTRSLHARADVALMHSRSYVLCVCECVCEMRGGAVCTRDFLVDCSEFSHSQAAAPCHAPHRSGVWRVCCRAGSTRASRKSVSELGSSRTQSSSRHTQKLTAPRRDAPSPSGSLPASPIVASWCPCMWAVVWLIAADVHTHGLTLEPYGFRTLKAVKAVLYPLLHTPYCNCMPDTYHTQDTVTTYLPGTHVDTVGEDPRARSARMHVRECESPASR
jgi:hypothetical protein